jgi:Na+/glutamate symporter
LDFFYYSSDFSSFFSSFSSFASAGNSITGAVSSIFSTFGLVAIAITSSLEFNISILGETFKSETLILSQVFSSIDKSTSIESTKSIGKHLTSNCLTNSSIIAHSSIFALELQTKFRGI